MGYLEELSYAQHIAHASRAAKDKKQQNKYVHKRKSDEQAKQSSKNTENVIEKLNQEIYQGEDRRSGKDRRHELANRGKYIESRQNKDRRHTVEISITI